MNRTWRVPVYVALLSSSGLLVGLVADGIGDVLAWAGLAVPVWLCARPAFGREARSIPVVPSGDPQRSAGTRAGLPD